MPKHKRPNFRQLLQGGESFVGQRHRVNTLCFLDDENHLPTTDGLMAQPKQILQPQRAGIANQDCSLHCLGSRHQSPEGASDLSGLVIEPSHLVSRPGNRNWLGTLDASDLPCTIVHMSRVSRVDMNGAEDGSMGSDGIAGVNGHLVCDDRIDFCDRKLADRHVKSPDQPHRNLSVLITRPHLAEVEASVFGERHDGGSPGVKRYTPQKNACASRRSALILRGQKAGFSCPAFILFLLLPLKTALAVFCGVLSLFLWGQFLSLAWRMANDRD